MNDDLPGLGELEGVATKIDQDLQDAQLVASDLQWQRRIDFEHQLHGLVMLIAGQHHGQFAQHVFQAKGMDIQLKFAGINLGEIQDIVQQCQQ